jgi:hypothetical protein
MRVHYDGGETEINQTADCLSHSALCERIEIVNASTDSGDSEEVLQLNSELT